MPFCTRLRIFALRDLAKVKKYAAKAGAPPVEPALLECDVLIQSPYLENPEYTSLPGSVQEAMAFHNMLARPDVLLRRGKYNHVFMNSSSDDPVFDAVRVVNTSKSSGPEWCIKKANMVVKESIVVHDLTKIACPWDTAGCPYKKHPKLNIRCPCIG